MLPISASEIASIQADTVSATCDKTCVIKRASLNTPDAYGSPTKPSYTTVETTVAGVAEPTGGQLSNYDYLIGSLKAYQVKLPINNPTTGLLTNVQEQDHLIIEGETLEVHVLLKPRSYEALRTVIAAEVV